MYFVNNRMQKIPFLLGLLLLSSLLLGGCQSDDSANSNSTDTLIVNQPVVAVDTVDSDGYPSSDIVNTYPVPIENSISESYPPVSVTTKDESLRFTVAEPLFEGSTSVSGTGPPASIRIVSISNVGETLGVGIIDGSGTFNIALSRPLNPKETIAVMLQDGVSQAEFLDAPGATDIPMIGFVLDMAVSATP